MEFIPNDLEARKMSIKKIVIMNLPILSTIKTKRTNLILTTNSNSHNLKLLCCVVKFQYEDFKL